MRLALLTGFTLVAFAANSLFCRMALGQDLIDPVSFTTLRLGSGALVLIPIARIFSRPTSQKGDTGSWASATALFAYAMAFSLAYITLSTGMGALVLFGAVQVTMIGGAIIAGDRLTMAEWSGATAALAGLVYLVIPGLSAPDPMGVALMIVSGAAWGIYSIRGRTVRSPVAMTAGNFLRAAPMALAVSVIALLKMQVGLSGALLAVASGAVTSGLGYVLWYKALKDLSTTQASVVQLLVPVMAAFLGVIFLSEIITQRLVVASLLILGGVGLAVTRRRNKKKPLP